MMIYQSTYSSHASVSGYSLTDTECVEQSCQMTKHIPMARDVSRALTVYRYPAVNKLTTTIRTHIHTERERRTQTHRQTDRQTLIESMTSCPLKGGTQISPFSSLPPFAPPSCSHCPSSPSHPFASHCHKATLFAKSI